MNPSRETILLALALEKSAAERSAFLDGACLDDPALRRRLEALLGQRTSAPESSSHETITHGPDPTHLSISALTEQPGSLIGRYRLLEEIGEGGFGSVWAAEQKEPVKRRVALKIIKLGMDTKQVVARFEAERQALAMMDHPNIAKVFDAGTTDTGRPYFVMEWVRGIRITDYCDQTQLSTGDRLELFIQVCHAIQHAHQKGIIHRDIKPSNILVTLHDGVPVPKVIDFGIAKATQQELTELTIYTHHHQFIGTPAYMSPEQAEMSGLDIDTRSDIYSLGVLLYELLAGSTPFDARELMAAGIDAMRRTIREREPIRPSTRLAALPGEQLTTTAKRRASDVPKLIRQLSGDLDWIVMKCLEKDRTRRYETANGLAADLRRHLANEPISARPPSTAYRFQKALRRHKLAFASAGLVTGALILGVLGSTWQAVRARQAEQLASQRQAEAERAREAAEAVAGFLSEVFQSPEPARDGRTITVAETLERASKKVESDLAGQPARRAQLQATLGRTYQALGLYRESIPLREKVRDYRLAHLGPHHPETLDAIDDLAGSYAFAGRVAEAIQLEEEALAASRTALGQDHTNTLNAMHNLAFFYGKAGRHGEALPLLEAVLPASRKIKGPEHPETITVMDNLAQAYRAVGRTAEGLALAEQQLDLSRKVKGPQHPESLRAMQNLAIHYGDAGRRNDAIRIQQEVLALNQKVFGPGHPDTLVSMHNLAGSYRAAGRIQEAGELVDAFARVLQTDPRSHDSAEANSLLGFSLDDLGRTEEAIRAWQEAVRLDPAGTAEAQYRLATRLAERQRYAEALPILRAARERFPTGDRAGELALWIAWLEPSTLMGPPGQPPPAARLDRELFSSWLSELRTDALASPAPSSKSVHFATVLVWLGQTTEHETLCRQWLEKAAESKDPLSCLRAARAYLIRPHPDPATLRLAADVAQQSMKLVTPTDASHPWSLLAAAMAALREGESALAADLLTQVLQLPGNTGDRRTFALAYRALARAKAGQRDAARADLNELEKLVLPFPPPPTPSPIVTRSNEMAVRLAMEEARSLIGSAAGN